MGEFRMPSLGADMDEGTLVEWRVAPGDQVRRGDIVASVETDKSVIDVEVFETGVVEELLVEPGERVAVGAALARIGSAATAGTAATAGAGTGSPTGSTAERQPTSAPTASPAEATPSPVAGGPSHRHASRVLSPLVRHLAERLHVDPDRLHGSGPGGRVTRVDVERAASTSPASGPAAHDRPTSTGAGRDGRGGDGRGGDGRGGDGRGGGARAAAGQRSSPRARRRAVELGVDLAGLQGSGPAGEVLERDVVAAAAAAATPAAAGASSAPAGAAAGSTDRMRAAIARTMERSNREIPHYHLSTTVDLEPLMGWLETRNADRSPNERILPAAAILRATALAAAAVPQVNGEWLDGAARLADGVHLGVLVSLRGGGLLAPVIRDASEQSVDELMRTLTDLVERTRRGALRASELSGATITITNLGDRGVDEVHGVVHPPQLAIVGVGRIAPRALVVDGEVLARRSAVLTLAGDHRATDGRTGSRFLNHLAARLADPDRLSNEEQRT